MSNTLLTREDVAALIEADPGFTDGQLDVAVAVVRSYCRWHIAGPRTEMLTLDGRGGTLLQLPTLHLVEVASVTVDGIEITDVDWSTNGTLERRACWPVKRRSIEVEVTHGHERCPEDVAGVIASIAQKLPLSTGGADVEVGVVEEQIGAYRYRLSDSTQTEGQLTDSHMYVLGPHRIHLGP